MSTPARGTREVSDGAEARPITTSAIVRLAAAIVILSALALYLAYIHGTPLVDDAYITLIYARSLAEGMGLTFTDGARVEGYTDFLWVLLGAGAIKAGADPVTCFRIASFMSALALMGAVWVWTERYSSTPPHLRFAPILLASTGALAFWALAGLETTAFAALVFVATAIVARPFGAAAWPAAGLLYFVATLAHPDAILWFGVAAAYAAIRTPRGAIAMTMLFAIPFAIYWGWRTAYFGDFLPNTAYAKNTASAYQLLQGAIYIVGATGLAGLATAVIVLRAFAAGLWRRHELSLMAAQIVVWAAYVIYVGGDALLMYRFWLPVLAPMSILLQESIAFHLEGPMRARRRQLLLGATALIAASTVIFAVIGPAALRIQRKGDVDASRIELGAWFAENTLKSDVIAVNAAGAIPYYSRRPAIDMLGLNDRHIARHGDVYDRGFIAHKKSDADYVLGQSPSFIVLSPLTEEGQPLTPDTSSLPSVSGLIANPRLSDEYVRVRIEELDEHEIVLARRDRAAQLIASGAVVEVHPE